MSRVGCEALDVDNTFHLWTGLSCGGRNGNRYHTVRVSEDSYNCGGTIQRLDVSFQIWTWINHIYYEIIFTWTVSYAMSTKHLLTFTVSALSLFHEMYPPFHDVSVISLCHERPGRGVDQPAVSLCHERPGRGVD
jgi:hypothetical protein